RLIEFQIYSQDWLDPSTFRIMYDLQHDSDTDAKKLRPIGGPWSFLYQTANFSKWSDLRRYRYV
ncbi:MAG: hypothetical protein ACKPKO_24455, partial [Candidatus Fonsibacter sp.]